VGLFFTVAPQKKGKKRSRTVSVRTLHRMECNACPLNNTKVFTPHMEPTGSKKPLVYILGEAPGKSEDSQGEQFVGKTGRPLRRQIPDWAISKVRFNNCVRTRPPGNKTPEYIEIECCRPSVVKDIEASKPQAILAVGAVPLHWALGNVGQISQWRGRRVPVTIGSHTCWLYPIYHPAYVSRIEGNQRPLEGTLGKTIKFDMKRCFDEVESLPDPHVYPVDQARDGLVLLDGTKRNHLQKLQAILNRLYDSPAVALDFETKNLRPYNKNSKILCFAVSNGKTTVACALDHQESGFSDLERIDVIDILLKFLKKYKGVKVAQNTAFELEWIVVTLKCRELCRIGRWEDTMLAGFVLDERWDGLDLDFLCLERLGIKVKPLSNIDVKRLDEQPVLDVLDYNALDAKFELLLWEAQVEEIKERGLQRIYEEYLKRLPTMVLAQVDGFYIDVKAVERLRKPLIQKISRLEKRISSMAIVKKFERKFKRFNPHAPDDVIDLLDRIANRDEVYYVDKHGKERRTSNDLVLKQINTPFTKAINRLRKHSKLFSTYIEPYHKGSENYLIYPDGKVHTNISTIGTDTGRTATNDPNVQNYPKRSESGRKVRRMIVPGKDRFFLSVDYGQIEARVAAMYSLDKNLVEALFNDYDIHAEWAKRIAMAYPRWIGGKKFLTDTTSMKKAREKAKGDFVFALLFGSADTSVPKRMELPRDKILPLVEKFWDQFSGVYEWQEKYVASFEKHGYVEMLTGRVRRAPLSRNQIINNSIQGVASDIVIDAMNYLSEAVTRLDLPDLQARLNVHDDLVFAPLKTEVDKYLEIIVPAMLDVPYNFVNVPITCEASWGTDWYRMDTIDTFANYDYPK
jgi:DNA polymerase I